jgi:5'(3')-deoxyribonucleotidase
MQLASTADIRPIHPDARLGVDIGRVIISGDGPDTSFIGGTDEEALRAPAIEGAFEALARLRARFAGRVWLVSKCGKRIEARTRTWLAHHRFFEVTGLDPQHLLFCRTRPEKAPICARLGVTCFVDDRLDVLASMEGIARTRLLFGANHSPDPRVTAVRDWSEVEAAILAASQGPG